MHMGVDRCRDLRPLGTSADDQAAVPIASSQLELELGCGKIGREADGNRGEAKVAGRYSGARLCSAH